VILVKRAVIFLLITGGLIAGCSLLPEKVVAPEENDILYVYPDGSMKFRGRPIPERDVVIYEDGYGGEKAAVRIRMEPLHPDFFRDTILVERVPVERETANEEADDSQTE